MVLTPAAVDALREAVTASLAYEDGADSTPWTLPQDVSQKEFLHAVQRHRVLQLLSANRAALRLPPELWATLEPRRRAEALRSLLQVHQLHRACEALRAADVPVLAFKGPALAVITTGDVTARGHGDIDLLVPPERLEDAFAALRAAGWNHAVDLPRATSWAWSYLVESTYESPMVSDHSRIDLHWRLDASRLGLPTFAECWEARRGVELLGREIQTLGPHHTLTHSCVHAAKDQWSWLRSLADVHRLMRLTPEYAPFDLRPCDRQTPAVVEWCVGLPSAWRGQHPRAAAATLAKAQRTQYSRILGRSERRPGAGWGASVRRRVSGNRSVAEWRWALCAVALPPASFAGQVTPRRTSALTLAVVRRAFRVRQRVLEYANAPRNRLVPTSDDEGGDERLVLTAPRRPRGYQC